MGQEVRILPAELPVNCYQVVTLLLIVHAVSATRTGWSLDCTQTERLSVRVLIWLL